MENIPGRQDVYPAIAEGHPIFGRPSFRCRRRGLFVRRVHGRKRGFAAARPADHRRKTAHRDKSGSVHSSLHLAAALRRCRKIIRRPGDVAEASPRKILSRREVRAGMVIEHSGERDRRAGAFSFEAIRARAARGLGAQSLLLESRQPERAAALPGRAHLPFCGQRRRAGHALRSGRDQHDQPVEFGQLQSAGARA